MKLTELIKTNRLKAGMLFYHTFQSVEGIYYLVIKVNRKA